MISTLLPDPAVQQTPFVCYSRGGSPYAPPAPKPLDVDDALKAITPVLGYENIGYFKFLSNAWAPALLDTHVSLQSRHIQDRDAYDAERGVKIAGKLPRRHVWTSGDLEGKPLQSRRP